MTEASQAPRIGEMSDTFSPFFYYQSEYGPLQNIVDIARERGSEDWYWAKIRRSDARVSFEGGNTSLPNVTIRLEYNLDQGENFTYFKSDDPLLAVETTRKYQQVAGLWVPVHSKYANRYNDGSREYRREVKWLWQKVNEPLPDDAFSLDSLGLLPGDTLSDHLSGTVSVFRADQVPRRSHLLPAPISERGALFPKPTPSPWVIALTAVGIVCALLVTGARIFIRYRRSSASSDG